MGWISDILSVAPAVVSLIGQDQVEDANDDAVEVYREGAQKGAKILTDSYDSALGFDLDAIDLEGELSGGKFRSLSALLSDMASGYEDSVRETYTGYGDMMFGAEADINNALLAADADARGMMGRGAEEFAAQHQPYIEAGDNALTMLREITGRAPDEFDPAQARLREKSIREMRSGLAASGLRGAGRAGVAAMNEGIADMDASLYSQNQGRIDSALSALSSMGYGSTGAVAGNNMDTANRQASTNLATRDKIASNRFATTKDVGNRMMAGEDAIARNALTYGDRHAGLTSEYYDDATRRGYSEGEARRQNVLGKGEALAAAETGPAFAESQANLATARSRGETYGAIGSYLTDAMKKSIKPNTSGAQPTFYYD